MFAAYILMYFIFMTTNNTLFNGVYCGNVNQKPYTVQNNFTRSIKPFIRSQRTIMSDIWLLTHESQAITY